MLLKTAPQLNFILLSFAYRLELMRYLIILRGPPGIGKSTVAEHIKNRLGANKTFILYLDRIEEFDTNVQKALRNEYVIAELFFGNSRTTRPELWLNKFTDYAKISFVMDASFETCFERAKNRPEYLDRSEEEYKVLYYGFKFLCLFKVFNQYGAIKEKCIKAQNDLATVADNILKLCQLA
jgi:thymidylate kinase